MTGRVETDSRCPHGDRRPGQQPEATHADAGALMPRNWPPPLVYLGASAIKAS